MFNSIMNDQKMTTPAIHDTQIKNPPSNLILLDGSHLF